jgi:hypothetical protein
MIIGFGGSDAHHIDTPQVANGGPCHIPTRYVTRPDTQYTMKKGDTSLTKLQPDSITGPHHISTQTAYTNIPHTATCRLKTLQLPSLHPQSVLITHIPSITLRGELLFHVTMRDHLLRDELIPSTDHTKNSNLYMCANLDTVNYILTGLQLYGNTAGNLWYQWYDALNSHASVTQKRYRTNDQTQQIHHILQYCITPFGVAASDSAADGSVSIVVDGRVQQLVEIYSHMSKEDIQKLRPHHDLWLELSPHNEQQLLSFDLPSKFVEFFLCVGMTKFLYTSDSCGV